MLTFCYAWTPLVLITTMAVLSLPWLAPIALLLLAFVAVIALAVLGRAIVVVPYVLGHAISRRWEGRRSASLESTATVSPAERQSASPAYAAPHMPE